MPISIQPPVVKTTIVASGTATNTVIKGTPGILWGFYITTGNTNAVNIFDNATTNSGSIVGAAAASAAIGLYPAPSATGTPCVNGITLAGNANNPAVTILWS